MSRLQKTTTKNTNLSCRLLQPKPRTATWSRILSVQARLFTIGCLLTLTLNDSSPRQKKNGGGGMQVCCEYRWTAGVVGGKQKLLYLTGLWLHQQWRHVALACCQRVLRHCAPVRSQPSATPPAGRKDCVCPLTQTIPRKPWLSASTCNFDTDTKFARRWT